MRPPSIETVQLILFPPKRPDTCLTKYARWPQPLGILSLGASLRWNNPGVDVQVLDGNNVLTLEQVKARLNADVVGISTTALGYEHALEIARAARDRGASIKDWYRHFCQIDFASILEVQEQVSGAGLVPYEMSRYQRRSWSGTPSKVFCLNG